MRERKYGPGKPNRADVEALNAPRREAEALYRRAAEIRAKARAGEPGAAVADAEALEAEAKAKLAASFSSKATARSKAFAAKGGFLK